jgi:hypothetical protein
MHVAVVAFAQLLEAHLGIAKAAARFAEPPDPFFKERERAIEVEIFLLEDANDLLEPSQIGLK